ncbi:MAG TPA: sigma-70 family RNA polymerase sigma factor [Burkholderiaceae bacterium]
MDIKPLLQKIAAGDKQAYANVVKHYQRPLFGFLGRMALSQSLAEEIAQETFFRAWKNFGEYKPEVAEFSTWLFTIARNLALNELSRSAYQHEVKTDEALPETACDRPQPSEELARKQQKQKLQDALWKLSLQDRSALALAYIHDLEMTAIARIEGCTTSAVKTRLHRAKEKLRQLLEEDDG